jgi:hypothetical protein
VQTVYVETAVPSYLAAFPSNRPQTAVDLQITHHWWNNERSRFRLYTSVFTLDEASCGDPGAAAHRLPFLSGIPILDIPDQLEALEADIIRLFRLPARACTDDSHPGLAILHRMDYLLTWNCTHLANAVLQKELLDYCQYHQLHVPIVCTPHTLTLTPQ